MRSHHRSQLLMPRGRNSPAKNDNDMLPLKGRTVVLGPYASTMLPPEAGGFCKSVLHYNGCRRNEENSP